MPARWGSDIVSPTRLTRVERWMVVAVVVVVLLDAWALLS